VLVTISPFLSQASHYTGYNIPAPWSNRREFNRLPWRRHIKCGCV